MKRFYTFIVFLLLTIASFAQNTSKEKLEKAIPQENIFVDYTSSLVFPGEYLYYKVYVTSNQDTRLSDLSKIAYVEMIDEHGETVFIHKIKLQSGAGYGDFFIPTKIASGSYKIIAFTNWMRNKGAANYFNDNLFIINPYTTRHENSLQRATNEALDSSNISMEGRTVPKSGIIELPDGLKYAKRQNVSLQFNSSKLMEGNYSLSVRKKNNFSIPNRKNISNFENGNTQKTTSGLEKESYIPELRGDLFKGKLSTTNNDLTVANQNLAISVPGENFLLNLSHTTKDGVFYFNFERQQSVDNIFIQVLGEQAGEFSIDLDSIPTFDFSSLQFPSIKINPEMENEIISRSLQNQVENSYYSVKPDTLKPVEVDGPFFGTKNVEVYTLDDYDRFPTVKETFIEIITQAKIRKDSEGNSVFGVYTIGSQTAFNSKALLLVDGLYIEETEDLMNYNANKIERIKVVRDEYYYGLKVFGGIILIETKDKDFYNTYNSPRLKNFKIIPVEPLKNYYTVNYEKQDLARIPDFRRQLLWKPNLDKPEKLNFYTSDVEGEFLITLQGIDKQGNKVFDQKVFTVQ